MTVRHPVFARLYPRLSAAADAGGGRAHRQELLAGLHGRVVELGAGHGANFIHYPAEVADVVAVEPEGELRRRAERAVRHAQMPINVVDGEGDSLEFTDVLGFRAQDTIDVVWPNMAGGCHCNRNTLTAIADTGFVLDDHRRFEFRPHHLPPPVAPMILGRAHKPW